MKKTRLLYTLLSFALLITGCGTAMQSRTVIADSVSAVGTASADGDLDGTLPDGLLDSYYAGQADPAFSYFHNSSIRRFFTMWVKEKMEGMDKPVWNYDGFARIHILDYDLQEAKGEEALYCLPFSDGGERFGYMIVQYHEDGPAVSKWSVKETTPYLYDLRANRDKIGESLQKTDIDLSTAKAFRVVLYDQEKGSAGQAIRFTDGKGDDYIGYFGDDIFKIEKWNGR